MAEPRSTMIDPPIEELLDKVDSKFTLVTLASKRARQINSYFNQLGEGLGAVVPPQVTSLARKPLSIAQFKAIEDALVDNELIILRGQDISSADLMAFGRRFNPLTVHPFAPNEGKNAPELIKFRNDEKTPPYGTDVWHSDETFRAEPPMARMSR